MSNPSFPQPPDEPSAATLLVRHLPEAIPHDLLSRLFSHFGASSFRPCSGGKLRNCAFVDFKDEISASRAQLQLNRFRIHKKVLSVERVTNSFSSIANQSKESQSSADPSARALPEVKKLTHAKGNTMGSLSYSEPIAPKLGVEYPFPPHLEYAYPPPDGNILTNIVNALIAVPRFYTQVLHLMNKMNIPPPFRMALPTPPLPPSAPAPPPPPPPSVSEQPPPADLSSEESELESSEEDLADAVRIRKRAKKEAILGPASDKGVAHEDVGLKPAALVPKEVPMIKKKNPVLQIKFASKSTSKETKDGGSLAEIVNEQENVQPKPYATMEEIENGKLPPEEILSLPMFKNYAAGNPAPVLYIKNLAKDVIADDFYYIFGSLFDDTDAAKSSLHVKLMQEGRMRGQAFVTFPSIDLAHRGLNLVNGFVFKGKPMIIQFGRNPAAPKVT